MKKITKKEWIIGIICFILGILLMLIFWPKRIAQLKSGEEVAIKLNKYNVTANDIYYLLKDKYSTTALFELVDNLILNDKYELTDEDEVAIKENAEYYFKLYESNYNTTRKDFLSQNGFKDEENFIKYLTLDYLRNKYYEEYINKNISDEDIEKYYNNNVFAPFDVEHILVKTGDDSETAKAKAEEILSKLNNGSSWDDIVKEYSSEITHESFEINFKSNLESSFDNAAKAMSDNSYSSSLVKTSYGYHIIYRKTTKEKPSLDSVKEDVIKKIANSMKELEEYDYQTILINMRKDAGMDIKDTEIKKAYDKYIEDLK